MKYRINPVTPYEQNSTLLWCEETGKAAVTDPGGDLNSIVKSIDEEGVLLEKIILTHGHIDHVGYTQQLAEKYSVSIIGPHKDDRFLFDEIDDYAVKTGLTHGGHFMPDEWLEDGEKVSVGNAVLNVLHCPGHTPGHIVLIQKQDRMAIVGDVLFQNSIGRTDFPRGNHADLLSSIKEKLFPFGDDIIFIPGHGPTSSFGAEKRNNPFLK